MARGVMYVHSAPAALCPHVEWAVAAALGSRVSLSWTPQPAAPGTFRAELPWQGPAGTASKIASAMRTWDLLRFEVTEDATASSDGVRFACTPSLGIHAAATNTVGDIVVSENRLRAARSAAADRNAMDAALDQLLGTPWDAELEQFRYAGDAAPGRLHRVG